MPVHRIYRAASPYNASELNDLDFEQTADVLYLAHENHAPTKLVRTGHAAWSFTTLTFAPSIAVPTNVNATATTPNTDAANSQNAYFPQVAAYVVTAYNEDTGQESRASTSGTATNDLSLKRNYNTITWNAVAGATGYRIYKSENTQLYGYIGTTEALTFTDDNIGPDLSEGPPIGDNPFVTTGDYPATITFHEQRSIWGRSGNRPNAIWASRSADYENMDFTRPSRADDAFSIGLVGNKVNSVNQLVSAKEGLLALTSNNIFVIKGANDDYLSASPPPRPVAELARGCSRLNPITIDNVIFYETAKLSSIRTIGYQFEMDGIKTDDLTIFSTHLFENQDIVDWAFAEKPGSRIWVVRGDGKMLCLTWEQEQQVWGWTLCETDGLFKSVTVVTENGEDRAYFVVERVIGGDTKLFIERMASDLWQDQVDACYLDCARSFSFTTPTATLERLEHLEGETVTAYADGFAVHDLVVAGGKVTLPFPASKITVGLPFTALIETLPLAQQTREGWTVARPQDAQKVVLALVNSREVEVGPDDDNLYELKLREQDAYGAATALYTGYKEAEMANTLKTEVTVVVRSANPFPMHVAAIMIDPTINPDG